MDFDDRKVYGDTSITADGLVLSKSNAKNANISKKNETLTWKK